MKIVLLVIVVVFQVNLLDAQTQVTEQWVSRYNGKGDFSDKFNCITTDNSGNIYLGGYTVRIGQNRDFLTVKMNANGDTLWTAVYNGPGNGADEVQAIAVDAGGNVLVTGFQKGNGTGDDYLTIKYNAAGDTLWTRVYNYTANDDDQANAIAVDGSGNVFVTGQSDAVASSVTNDDFATIKYSSAGAIQWVIRYGDIYNGTDRAVGIVTDNNGNSYVTGRSFNGNDDDFYTIKYNGSGIQQWAVPYDGGIGNDRAVDIAIDGSANICITGRSDNGTNDDILTVKYNSAGAVQWFKTYDYVDNDRPTAITFDGSGNVYVTGQSDSDPTINKNYDFITLKYNSAGTQQWSPRYNGSGNGEDIPFAIIADNSGNVYVAGESDTDPSAVVTNKDCATVKYNASGVEQYVKFCAGTANSNESAVAMAFDNSGNIIVAGDIVNISVQKEAVAIKYNAAGTLLWTKIYSGPGDNYDNVNAMTTDAAGFIYLAGYSVGYGTDRDMCTAKLNSSGDTIWVRKYNGLSDFVDEATAVKVDASGNVYVTGFTRNPGVSNDYTTIKYNSNGDTVWVRMFESSYGHSDKASSIDVDASGNVYVTGYSKDFSGLHDDVVTIKYNSAGQVQFAVRFNGAANLDDNGVAVAAFPSGNVYVAGSTDNGTNLDILLLKYNSSGSLQWARAYNGGNGDDQGVAMTSDNSENIYITGNSRGSGGLYDDIVTVKFNSAGVQQWAPRYNAAIGNDDVPSCIALDAAGNVYVAGTSVVDVTGGARNHDYIILKYNAGGTEQWAKNYNGLANTDDVATSIAVDNLGFLYVTGESENGSSVAPDKDYATLKYDTSGNEIWYGIYNGSGSGADRANAVAYSNGKVYVSGGSWGSNSHKDMLTLAYNAVIGIAENKHDAYSISFYPNPADSKLYLSGIAENLPDIIDLQIKDISGRIIASSRIHISETLDISSLAPGIYCVFCDREFIGKLEIMH